MVAFGYASGITDWISRGQLAADYVSADVVEAVVAMTRTDEVAPDDTMPTSTPGPWHGSRQDG